MKAPGPLELIAAFVPCVPTQDQERRTPLHAAAYLGDVAILELLILSGKGQGSGHSSRVLGHLWGIFLIPSASRGAEQLFLVAIQAAVCSSLSQWGCSQGKIRKCCYNPRRFVQTEKHRGAEIAEVGTQPGGRCVRGGQRREVLEEAAVGTGTPEVPGAAGCSGETGISLLTMRGQLKTQGLG